MSPRTSCFARMSSSSAGNQTMFPVQDCSAATRRSMEALPSCLTSMMLKTSGTRTTLLAFCCCRFLGVDWLSPTSGGTTGSNKPRSLSTRVKASSSRSLKRSSVTLRNASRTFWYLWQHCDRKSSRTQEGANCRTPFRKSMVVSVPLWSLSMSWKRSRTSASLKSSGNNLSFTLCRLICDLDAKSSAFSSTVRRNVPLMLRKRWRTLNRRSSSK
mmetsp:Transcript_3161/g.7359  ORF Transcript_3161/g.7359 Transcript_3161/m.7359 type:complete len:214 (-) Transcript_3161:227-868(-)